MFGYSPLPLWHSQSADRLYSFQIKKIKCFKKILKSQYLVQHGFARYFLRKHCFPAGLPDRLGSL